MIVAANGPALLEAFSASVSKLLEDIKTQAKWIEENDNDVETTTNYMVNRKLREWFNRGGNMGY
jgi:hypothetical protein